MRLTFRLASAGNGCIFRYPGLADESAVKTNGVFDEAKCRRQFAALQDLGYCLGSSSDKRNAVVTAAAFLYNLKECADKMIAKAADRRDAGDRAAPHAFADSPADRRASRKLDHGQSAFVRVDVRETWPVRICVSWDNPLGGDMQDEWCRDVALLCIEVADAMSEKSSGKCVPVEGHRCAGFIERARDEERRHAAERERAALEASRRSCPNRVGDYCSPIAPDCPCYFEGRCTSPSKTERTKK